MARLDALLAAHPGSPTPLPTPLPTLISPLTEAPPRPRPMFPTHVHSPLSLVDYHMSAIPIPNPPIPSSSGSAATALGSPTSSNPPHYLSEDPHLTNLEHLLARFERYFRRYSGPHYFESTLYGDDEGSRNDSAGGAAGAAGAYDSDSDESGGSGGSAATGLGLRGCVSPSAWMKPSPCQP